MRSPRAHFVSQLQTVVSREVKPVSPAVVTVGELHAGRARNVIAGTAELKGIVRTLEPGLSERIEAAVRRMLEGIKTGMRVDYTLAWNRMAPVLRNDAAVLASVVQRPRGARRGQCARAAEPSMGSEDFAWFAERVPAAHLRIGAKIDGLDTAIHRSDYDCNELAIPVGIRVLARAALDLGFGRPLFTRLGRLRLSELRLRSLRGSRNDHAAMKWFDLSRTVVLPLHCDGYGHMNVRNYAGFFDDAGWHVLAMAGISLSEVRSRGLGTVVATLTIDFHHEIVAGQLALVRGAVTRVGTKSFATS